MASDVNKPNGIFVVTPDRAQEFIDKLEVRKFFGIGKVTTGKLHEIGIWRGADLKNMERLELVHMFGKAGNYYYDICRREDDRLVLASRQRKSVGAEQTFLTDLFSLLIWKPNYSQFAISYGIGLSVQKLKAKP